jgi:predicted  nucleic acid-binding Zn-ribbon protein
VNPELQSLISLQDIDLKIIECNRRTSEIPQQISRLQDSLHAHEAQFNRIKEEAVTTHKERRRLEGEVETARTKLSKYKEQLMVVKTNKEYQAMQMEIKVAESEIDKMEYRILELMEQSDQTEREVKKKETELKTEKEKVLAQQRELENTVQEMQKEIEHLTAERNSVERTISGELLDQYHRVANRRRGIALAEAKDESCQVCHVRMRPQVFNDVRRSVEIIACESCGRILYWKPNSAAEQSKEGA